MPEVYIKLPKTGLGNMLLVWARGLVFAQLNNLPYSSSSWWGLHWGALLRREKKSRLYLGYFKETPLWKQIVMCFYCRIFAVEKDPPVSRQNKILPVDKKVYVFQQVLTGNDLFGSLRDHQQIVAEGLNNLLAPKMKVKLAQYSNPVIGVHIRRGDFKLGNQTTPLEYFIAAINTVRKAAGENLPVTIFTDADESELTEILLLPGISIAEKKPDILDILLMGNSKLMILSKSSTFSYWAAFLSDAIVIRPHNDWQKMIKQNGSTINYCEINWDHTNEIAAKELTNKITACKNIFYKK